MFDGHLFGFGGGFMWLLWLVLIAVVVWALVTALRAGNAGTGHAKKSPREILEERFARGEIDDEEFKRRRDLLDD